MLFRAETYIDTIEMQIFDSLSSSTMPKATKVLKRRDFCYYRLSLVKSQKVLDLGQDCYNYSLHP